LIRIVNLKSKKDQIRKTRTMIVTLVTKMTLIMILMTVTIQIIQTTKMILIMKTTLMMNEKPNN